MKTLDMGKTFQLSLESFLEEEYPDRYNDTYTQALAIVKDAMHFRSVKIRMEKAKEALCICAGCAEAYMLYAASLEDVFMRLEILKNGYEQIAISLGKNYFLQEIEDYYLENAYPYFKIRYAYSLCLFECGFLKEALMHFEHILKLNPQDVFKVREYLYVLYLYYEDLNALQSLLERFKDRDTLYVYVLFILEIKRKNFVQAKKILPLLKEMNLYLFEMITNQRIYVGNADKKGPLGSEEEAGYVYSLLSLLFEIITPLQSFIANHT